MIITHRAINLFNSLYQIFNLPASQRVPGKPEVPLVPRAGDIRPRDIREAESVEGDVRCQSDEEQDHQLRARVN